MRLFVFLICCFNSLLAIGQEANFSLAEKFMESNVKNLVGSLQVKPRFINGSDNFWFSFSTTEGVNYYLFNPKTGVKELFDRDYLAGELMKIVQKPIDAKRLNLWSIGFDKKMETITFSFLQRKFNYHLGRKILQEIKGNVENLQILSREQRSYSSDSTYYVYVKHHDLYLRQVQDSSDVRLTWDGELGYSYAIWDEDTTTYLPANVRWFKNSTKFYAYRGDKRNIAPFYLVNSLSKKRPRLKSYKYVLPGDEQIVKGEIIVFDARTKERYVVPIDKWKNQYVSIVGIEELYPQKLFFVRCSREYDEIEVCRFDPESKEFKVLFGEVAKPRFNTELYTLKFINGGKNILWWSERSGYGHYYLYDKEGRFVRQLTAGAWTAGPLLRVDSVSGAIFFKAYGFQKGSNPYYAQVCRASLRGGDVCLLTPEEATHNVSFSSSGRYFVDNYSRPDKEPRSVVRNSKTGKIVCSLPRPDLSRLYAMGWKFPESFKVKAADGITDLYGIMWKPFDFDSSRCYPIVSHVYPGPHTEEVPLEFTISAHYNVALAQIGCIVVAFGQRGSSPLRGKVYDTYGYGNMRDYALPDNKCGLEQLADRFSFIDGKRIGIFGHSGGGMMAAAALCMYPDFYAAAVSSSGNHDNNIYNSSWVGYVNGLDIEEETGKVYVRDSVSGKDTAVTVVKECNRTRLKTNMDIADRLKGHLLLVTGDMDDNVHPAHTYRMVSALIRARKKFELIVLPGIGHLYSGEEDAFFQRKMWFHFAKYLMNDFSCEKDSDMDKFHNP